jgi:hypothetical protein
LHGLNATPHLPTVLLVDLLELDAHRLDRVVLPGVVVAQDADNANRVLVHQPLDVWVGKRGSVGEVRCVVDEPRNSHSALGCGLDQCSETGEVVPQDADYAGGPPVDQGFDGCDG